MEQRCSIVVGDARAPAVQPPTCDGEGIDAERAEVLLAQLPRVWSTFVAEARRLTDVHNRGRGTTGVSLETGAHSVCLSSAHGVLRWSHDGHSLQLYEVHDREGVGRFEGPAAVGFEIRDGSLRLQGGATLAARRLFSTALGEAVVTTSPGRRWAARFVSPAVWRFFT